MTPKICIAQNPDADALLSESPLALLIGMLLDQQIPMEVAFNGPFKLYTRLGNSLDVNVVAEYDPDEWVALSTTPPAIHRYGASMGKRVQVLCQYLVAEYDGDVSAIWERGEPDGKEVLKRLKGLPGYGEQKAKIFLALLGKQLGVVPVGWREAAGDYGVVDSRKSVADVTSAETLAEVRATKKAAKAAAKQG
ncbi:HhH-GPD-type base excision DNA repair protein [Actinokineospora auranticolor]|uniref:Putative HhH-GPD family protein n=1 Tax=Actinokineospora auranticolor TaxID=155976 RepID=A0A2S6GWU2_9PSEU|nr:HhH-GPD-type base excision DNA repair protein [Actinokineospora auranticolor]PPK69673.1 putative HhH-GPD family protein [Actinokineospora auranticolor]